MRNGDEATGGGKDYEGLVAVQMRKHVATMSLQPPPPKVLNVKCLTGRLSEEELQRTMAPLEPGGGMCRVQRLLLPGRVFVSCLMPGSHCHSVLQ